MSNQKKEHIHTTHEEVRKCTASFGWCWNHPRGFKREDYSNTPNGETGLRIWRQV